MSELDVRAIARFGRDYFALNRSPNGLFASLRYDPNEATIERIASSLSENPKWLDGWYEYSRGKHHVYPAGASEHRDTSGVQDGTYELVYYGLDDEKEAWPCGSDRVLAAATFARMEMDHLAGSRESN